MDAPGKVKTNFDLLRDLAKGMGKKDFAKINEDDVKKIYSKAIPKRKLMPFRKRADIDVKSEMILESVSSSLLAASRLFWLKETERAAVSR